MKLIAQVKLKPSAHQYHLLKATLERANAAYNAISEYAWTHRVFRHYALHQALYTWYLLATCDVSEPTPDEIDTYLGVDRGVINLATDSDGNIYQGDLVEARR